MYQLMIQKSYCRILILAIALIGLPTMAQDIQYGQTTFPNSGADEAQQSFMEGLLMLHSFEYSDARKAFQRASAIDESFAMAYWGEALTHYRVLWNEIELEKVRDALGRLGETPKARADNAPTQREKDYLATVEILLDEGEDSTRAVRFAEALEILATDYPDDENAAAFYALALLGSSGADRDFAIYMKSAAVSEAVIANNPRHPGAVHYLIHAYDDPVHAPLGLRPALMYAQIAPAATHALHMPSHIFFPMGMWQAATDINLRSYAAGQAWGVKNGKPVNGSGAHALSWLVYSLLQEGRIAEARSHMLEFQDLVTQEPARTGQFVETWASYVISTDFADVEFVNFDLDASKMPSRQSSMIYFVKAAAAINSGALDVAESNLRSLAALEMKLNDLNWSEKAQDVMVLELQALLQRARGNMAEAVSLLEEAASLEYSMPRRFGPPWPPKPAHELLGELLAEQGDFGAAMRQFKMALSLARNRTPSLLGLARAASALDREDDARRAYQSLHDNLQRADSNFTTLQEAQEHTKSGTT